MVNLLFNYFNKNRRQSEQYVLDTQIESIKQYPRAKIHLLPEPQEGTLPLTKVVQKRKSQRDFRQASLSEDDLGHILYWSLCEKVGQQDTAKTFVRRPYPSGGAKFPVEVYVLCHDQQTFGNTVYHYRPDEHMLETVRQLNDTEIRSVKQSFSYPFVSEVPALILFTYIRERNVPKYGYFGEKLGLIEAGHMAQNMCLHAAEKNVSTVPLGGGDSDLIEGLLYADGYNESYFYAIALGKLPEIAYDNSDVVK